jgi:hypothetical protein
MDALRKSGDSVGARITVVADGVPPGWGEPIYGKLDGELAAALMSINAVKGVEIGDGFARVAQRGSEHRDEISRTASFATTPAASSAASHRPAGGGVGGVQADLEPAPAARSLDLDGSRSKWSPHGRHDPCVGIARNAHLRSDGGAGADGPGAAPSRAVRRRRRCVAAHRARRGQTLTPRRRNAFLFLISQHFRDTTPMTSKTFTVAVVGATGAVGETMLSILAERDFPVGDPGRARERALGRHEVKFGTATWSCRISPRSIRRAWTSRCSPRAVRRRRNTRRSSPPPARW